MMNIGAKIKTARIRKRLTLNQLADRIGKHTSVVSRYETGKTSISTDTLEAIAKALGIKVETLLRQK